jgi:hypothetical protein
MDRRHPVTNFLASLSKYRWLFAALAVCYLALGFGWPLSPGARMDALALRDSIEAITRERADAVRDQRVDSLVVRQARGAVILEGLGRVGCQKTPVEYATAGIPCRELLGRR